MAQLQLRGAPPEISAPIDAWFAAGRLALPIDVVWEVQVHPDPWFDAPGATAVRQGEVAVEPRADGSVRIAHPEGIDVVVDAGAPNAAWTIAEELVPHVDEWLPTVGMLVLLFGLRRVGWHHLHAASAVAPDGTGWIFVGASGSGKSTTVAALGGDGWRIGGDDAVFLAESSAGILAHPWCGTIGLRDGGRTLLAGASQTGMVQARDPMLFERGKDRRDSVAHGFEAAEPFVPQVVAFTSLGTTLTVATPASPSEALGALIAQSAWVALEPEHADGHMRLLERLLRHARPVQLSLAPDLPDSPSLLTGLLLP